MPQKRVSAGKAVYREKRRIAQLRSHTVVKANALIQNSRYNLSVQEQRIILYMISRIEPGDTDFRTVSFSVQDFCKICGIDFDNGGNYRNVKDAIKSLSDKSVWVTSGDKEILLRWIYSAEINKKSGNLSIRISDDVKPYLLQLKSRFTKYELIYTLAMKSQYSIRLYELLKSYEYRGTAEFGLEELKRLAGAETYERMDNLRARVLDIAVGEINRLTDISIAYTMTRQGRKYSNVVFTVKTKKELGERIETWSNIENAIASPKEVFEVIQI